MPRSGTTWLSQIFEAHSDFVVRLSPNYSYPLKNRLTKESDAQTWSDVLHAAVESDDPFLTQDWQRAAGNLPRFDRRGSYKRLAVKDTRFHEVYLAGMDVLPKARCIYIVRNPMATLDSWRRSPEFPAGADFGAEWRSGACRKSEGPGEYWGFDDWVTLTADYADRQRSEPLRYRLVRYEDLVDAPGEEAASLFEFAGSEISDSVLDFLSSSHGVNVEGAYSVFKDPSAVRDQWADNIDPAIQREIRESLDGTALAEYLR